jgi:hypothetical protein
MEISIQTLAVCVEAVDAKATELQEQIAAMDAENPVVCDLEDLLLTYSKAGIELKRLYIEAQKGVANFPPYEELLK